MYTCTEYEDNSALSLETDATELLGKTIDLQLSEVIFRVNNYTNENFFCRHCFFFLSFKILELSNFEFTVDTRFNVLLD